jgi:uncharacterized protein (TIGR02757 family)
MSLLANLFRLYYLTLANLKGLPKRGNFTKADYLCKMNKNKFDHIKSLLDEAVIKYNQVNFIKDDPIQIPHGYTKKQDIEITAFWSSMLAWGQRKTIINKSKELFGLMDNAPHDFILNHEEKDLKPFESFKHRTFQPTDCLYFIDFFKRYYQEHDSLETAFSKHLKDEDDNVKNMLIGFHDSFFDHEFAPQRTKKHIATPTRKSACKKMNMFLRWMVRQDDKGVDFGIWKSIPTRVLMMPLDVHVQRVALKLGLLTRTQSDFKAVIELTDNLKQFDAEDPVRYDFALFGLGLEGFAK